jgi:O-antigen/teichoic acid export membrane protein
MARVKRFVSTSAAYFASQRSARNVVWNLLGGVSAGVMTILATPVYVSRLGLAGYAIIGLWLVMQVMIGLLDMGMGASVVRSFAGALSGRDGDEFRRDLLRTLEYIYWIVAVVLAVILALAANWIGTHWLKSTGLSNASVTHALQLMGIALGFQFASVLYTNGLTGLQAQGTTNALATAANVMRYGGGVVVLLWKPDLPTFFAAQAVVAALQTLVTRWVLWGMISSDVRTHPAFRLDLIRQLWRYSVGMAFSSVAAVLMSNTDRIFIGSLLPAAELGKYSVAFTATGLLQLGIQPFYRAFFPRYAELVAAGDHAGLRTEYYRSCQLVAACIIPLAIVGWVFAPELLAAWLGRPEETITIIFRWLLIAISCAGLVWLPAAYQQANGWTRLHASMIAGALVIGAPLMYVAIRLWGTVGATTVWVLHGLSAITIELWLMHRRLLVGELLHWYRVVVVQPLLVTVPVVAVSRWLLPSMLGRWGALGWVGTTALCAIALTLFFGLGGAYRHRMTVPQSGTN